MLDENSEGHLDLSKIVRPSRHPEWPTKRSAQRKDRREVKVVQPEPRTAQEEKSLADVFPEGYVQLPSFSSRKNSRYEWPIVYHTALEKSGPLVLENMSKIVVSRKEYDSLLAVAQESELMDIGPIHAVGYNVALGTPVDLYFFIRPSFIDRAKPVVEDPEGDENSETFESQLVTRINTKLKQEKRPEILTKDLIDAGGTELPDHALIFFAAVGTVGNVLKEDAKLRLTETHVHHPIKAVRDAAEEAKAKAKEKTIV